MLSKGKIKIIKEDILQEDSKNFHIFQDVLYKVLGVNPAEVIFSGRHQKEDVSNVGVILLIGEFILNDVLGLKGIVKHAGQVLYYKNIPTIPIVSPGYLEYNPNYLQTYVEHIQKACYIAMGVEQEKISNDHVIVNDIKQVQDLAEYCKQTGYCSFDFETTELTDMGTFDPDFYCTTLSISFQQGSSYVIPLYHYESPFNEDDINKIFQILEREVFGNPTIIKVGQNIKFDMHCLVWNGVTSFLGPYHDTMLLHHLQNEIPSHKLKDIVRELFSQFANYETDLGKKDWSKINLEDLARYNALDSDLTLRVYWILIGYLLNEEERLYLMFRNYIAPATKILFQMEESGMLVDKAFITEAIRKVSGFIEEQEQKMRSHPEVIEYERITNEYMVKEKLNELYAKITKDETAVFKSKSAQENQQKRIAYYKDQIEKIKIGEIQLLELEPINFNSPNQLKELLFSSIGFNFTAPLDSYKRKNDSTGADNLDLIKDNTGFLEELKIYRQLQKISSTYLKSILNKLDCNHNVHTDFHQHGTKTGRLAARNPNLQNIITRTKYKVVEDSVAMVKKSFIVPEGYTMIQADYSQIELRIIAYFAQEDTMLRAYMMGQDLHELTAANSHGYTVEQFKALPEKEYKKLRFQAKAENFGYCYGISPQGFKEYARTNYNVDITLKEAERLREAFFKKYPKLLKYHNEYIQKARKFKYVRTFMGRKIHLPEIDSEVRVKMGHAERNAINSPIQGTAGELTIWALVLLSIRLPKDLLIVNTIHDSIIFYCPDSKIDEYTSIIKETMEKLPLKQYFGKEIDTVPIKVEFEYSKESWKDLHN